MLEALGASVEVSMIFPDHYRLTDDDITRIIDEARARGAEVIVTTQKDIARLGERCPIPNLYALCIRLEIEDSSRFADEING
jgi:tetraacyldisaccharide-1-P 4'-kinase